MQPSLLTSWTLDPLQLLPVLLLALAYGLRARTLHSRGTPVPTWRMLVFATGIALLLLAFASPDRRDRRGGALQLPHAPARADRRSRAALPARRLDRPDPAAAAGAPTGRAAARARQPARRTPALGGQPLPLAPAVSLRGGRSAQLGARARAHRVLLRGARDVAAGAGDAARSGVVRHRRQARLHRRRPPRRDRPRQHLPLVRRRLLRDLRGRRRALGDLADPRPGARGCGDDARGLARHDRRAGAASSSGSRARARCGRSCSSEDSTRGPYVAPSATGERSSSSTGARPPVTRTPSPPRRVV